MSTRPYKSTTDDNNLMNDPKEYQSIIESKMYAMLCIRLDLVYTINQISQFSNSSNESHYTVDIIFNGSLGLRLELYCDANWAHGEDRKSISAYIVMLADGAVSWRAKGRIKRCKSSSATAGEITRMRSGSDERTSSPDIL